MPFADIISRVTSYRMPYVCVTGGEPLLQKGVICLMEALCDRGFRLSLETGGSLDISDVPSRVSIILDIKCPQSKMSHRNRWENLDILKPEDEVKFVIADRGDYDFAKEICLQYALEEKVRSLLFSPVFDVLEPKMLVEWIMEDCLNVRLNLQVHKWIWSPETKGV